MYVPRTVQVFSVQLGALTSIGHVISHVTTSIGHVTCDSDEGEGVEKMDVCGSVDTKQYLLSALTLLCE